MKLKFEGKFITALILDALTIVIAFLLFDMVAKTSIFIYVIPIIIIYAVIHYLLEWLGIEKKLGG